MSFHSPQPYSRPSFRSPGSQEAQPSSTGSSLHDKFYFFTSGQSGKDSRLVAATKVFKVLVIIELFLFSSPCQWRRPRDASPFTTSDRSSDHIVYPGSKRRALHWIRHLHRQSLRTAKPREREKLFTSPISRTERKITS